MERSELKGIIKKIIEKLQEEVENSEAPQAACIFYDNPCDVTTKYAINEEA